MTTYIFHRAEGFYPLDLNNVQEAIESAEANPGTIMVTDTNGSVCFLSITPPHTLGALLH